MDTSVTPSPQPVRRRRRSKSPAPRKRSIRVFAGAIGGIVVALSVFTAVWWQRLDRNAYESTPATVASESSQPPNALETALEEVKTPVSARQNFRYSVVPGGVRSPEELADAIRRDKVVAAHYDKLDTTKLRVEKLSAPLQAHVSYRIGDRVYWTNRKLTLSAGEQVLTDGQNTIRARCGNAVSLDPLLPTLDNEPKPETFDLTVAPLSASTGSSVDPKLQYFTPPHLTTQVPRPGGGGVPFGPPGYGGTPSFGVPPVGGGTRTGSPSGDPPTGGAPPNSDPPGGNPPPGNPPGENPPGGNPPGNPPGGDPPGGNPPGGNPPGGNPPGGNPPGGNPPGGDPPGGDPPGGNPPGGNPPGGDPPRESPEVPTPVPEPGTLLLVAGGAAFLLARRLRHKPQ